MHHFLRSSLLHIQREVPFHVLGNHLEGVAGPHVTDGVAALVRRAVEGVGWAGAPLVVGQGGVRLQSVTEREERGTNSQERRRFLLKGADRKLTTAHRSRCWQRHSPAC